MTTINWNKPCCGTCIVGYSPANAGPCVHAAELLRLVNREDPAYSVRELRNILQSVLSHRGRVVSKLEHVRISLTEAMSTNTHWED